LDEVFVHRGRRRLHDEDVGPADVLVDLKRHLAVGEAAKPRLPDRNPEEVGNLLRQLRVGAPRKYLEVTKSRRHQPFTAQWSLHGSSWLGRKDSNLRIRDPKSRALPLGHAPPRAFGKGTPLRRSGRY